MGKHFVAGYGLNTSPVLFGSNAKNRSLMNTDGSAEHPKLAFNFIHQGYVEYATSRKWMIGFCARYYKTTYDNSTILPDHTREVMYTKQKYPSGYYNITGLSYSFYFKAYSKKYMAPWGKYIMFGPVLNTTKTTYDPAIMYANATSQLGNNSSYYNHDTLINYFGPKTQSFKGFNIMFGMGRSRIIAKRLVLDYGFNLYVLSFFPNLVLTYHDNITPENYIQKTVSRRVRGVNHINVFLKVGILLF